MRRRKFDEANSISGAMLNKFKRRRNIGGKGVGEGTRKTACLQTSIFYFRLFVLTELFDQ